MNDENKWRFPANINRDLQQATEHMGTTKHEYQKMRESINNAIKVLQQVEKEEKIMVE